VPTRCLLDNRAILRTLLRHLRHLRQQYQLDLDLDLDLDPPPVNQHLSPPLVILCQTCHFRRM
jgi:hypothetical protein